MTNKNVETKISHVFVCLFIYARSKCSHFSCNITTCDESDSLDVSGFFCCRRRNNEHSVMIAENFNRSSQFTNGNETKKKKNWRIEKNWSRTGRGILLTAKRCCSAVDISCIAQHRNAIARISHWQYSSSIQSVRVCVCVSIGRPGDLIRGAFVS